MLMLPAPGAHFPYIWRSGPLWLGTRTTDDLPCCCMHVQVPLASGPTRQASVSGSDAGHSPTGASMSTPSMGGEPTPRAPGRTQPDLKSAVQQAAKSTAALVSCGGAQYAPSKHARGGPKNVQLGTGKGTMQAGCGDHHDLMDLTAGQPVGYTSTPLNDGLATESSPAASPLRVQPRGGSQEVGARMTTTSQEPAGPSMSMPRHFQAQSQYQEQPNFCQRSYHFAVEIWPGPTDTVFRHTKVCSL